MDASYSAARATLRGTQWICSSQYLFFRPIFAGWEMCPWKESVAKKKTCLRGFDV